MKENKKDISKNYAKALYDAAVCDALPESVMEDTQKLVDLFSGSSLIKDLKSPLLGTQRQKELLRELSDKLSLSQTTTNFLYVLADNGRLSLLNDILKTYQKIYLKEKNIIEVEVETAVLLDEKQIKTLTKGLNQKLKKEIVLHQKLNEHILGGLILRYLSYEIDDSLLCKIKSVEKIMKGL